MFLFLTLMTRFYILIITSYLDISMLYLCRITSVVLLVLFFKLLNQLHIKNASSHDISWLCTFHPFWSYLAFTSAFNNCIYLLSKCQHRIQQHNLFKDCDKKLWNSEHLQRYELSKERRVSAFPVLQLFCEISNINQILRGHPLPFWTMKKYLFEVNSSWEAALPHPPSQPLTSSK